MARFLRADYQRYSQVSLGYMSMNNDKRGTRLKAVCRTTNEQPVNAVPAIASIEEAVNSSQQTRCLFGQIHTGCEIYLQGREA